MLVLLSKYEAYGLVVAEALACKTPCIVANTSALSEWIDNRNVFGIDYPICIKKLVNLIKEVSGVSVEGVNLLTWDVAVKKLKRVYRGV